MNVLFNKKFLKELLNLPKKERAVIENFVFEELPNYHSVQEVGKIEKLKGYNEYYKMRFGNYRIGLSFDGETLTLQRVLHRKEIYKFFP